MIKTVNQIKVKYYRIEGKTICSRKRPLLWHFSRHSLNPRRNGTQILGQLGGDYDIHALQQVKHAMQRLTTGKLSISFSIEIHILT